MSTITKLSLLGVFVSVVAVGYSVWGLETGGTHWLMIACVISNSAAIGFHLRALI